MMFYRKVPHEPNYPASDYFRDLDLSYHLEFRKAILVASTSEPLSKIKLNGQQAGGKIDALHFVRFVLPVKPGKEEPEFVLPPRYRGLGY